MNTYLETVKTNNIVSYFFAFRDIPLGVPEGWVIPIENNQVNIQ